MSNLPDYLPTLSGGDHHPESGYACVMEYVSVIAGEEWTDRPLCTHPFLAAAAIHVNDNLWDEDRHLLVPLISRLIGTTEGHHAAYCSTLERDVATLEMDHPVTKALDGYGTWCHSVSEPYNKKATNGLVAWLTGMLDTYDQVTGRTAPEVTEDQFRAAVLAVTGA